MPTLRLALAVVSFAALVAGAGEASAQRAPAPSGRTTDAIVTAMSGPREIKLRVPSGDCALERTNAADNRLITTTERLLANINVLHLTTVNCKTLTDWRAGRVPTLGNYTQVQSQITPDTIDHTGKERGLIKTSCTAMREHGDAVTSGVTGELEKRLAAGRDKIKLAGNAFLGVLAEDANGCYLGLLVRLVPQGSDKIVERLAIYAHVILAGRTTFLYRVSADVSPASLARLIEDRKAAAADHVALNGGYGTAL